MDWQNQFEAMTKAWAETQKKMWEQWTEAGAGLEQSPVAETWAKFVKTWEDSVKTTLEAQERWQQTWTEGLGKLEGAPQEVLELAQQAQEMSQRWSEAQKQLWERWFEAVKEANPAQVSGSWPQEGQKALQAWQEQVQKVFAAQAEWFRDWMEKQTGSKPDEPAQ